MACAVLPIACWLDKNRHHLEWARIHLEDHGVWIIIVARFIPGGRTATTYVAGTVGMPWKRRFLPADAIAVAAWSLYASALGYLGGASFEDNFWLPMLIGAGASLLVGAIGELVRRTVLDRGTEEADRTPGSRPAGGASAQERQPADQRRRPRLQRQSSTLSHAPRAALPGDGWPVRSALQGLSPVAFSDLRVRNPYPVELIAYRRRHRGPRVLGRVAGYLPLHGGNFDRPRRTAVLYTRE